MNGTLSLYTITPKVTGMTTDILLATEATETPLICEVFAIRTNIKMNKKPNANAPGSQGLSKISVNGILVSDPKNPRTKATA